MEHLAFLEMYTAMVQSAICNVEYSSGQRLAIQILKTIFEELKNVFMTGF